MVCLLVNVATSNYALREIQVVNVALRFTRDVGGYSFLYADLFMNEEEFEQMFDLSLYKKV